jgi:DtxR family transcriptional regulator, iron-dependent repressor
MPVSARLRREYLETIYNLTVEGDPIVGARLAEKFGVSQPAVAEVLRRMQSDGLIAMPGRGRGRAGEGIELTARGKSEAEELLRQHRLAERFLADMLGMDWVQAHEEAHNLEMGMSPAIIEGLITLLNNPRTCPHGNPIPNQAMDTTAYLHQQHALRLSDADPDDAMKVLLISEVVEDESALLTYLGRINIKPGAQLTLLEKLPGGEYRVRVVPRKAKLSRSLGSEDAEEATEMVTLTGDLASKVWVVKTG